jgi:hypothetical protein
MRGEFTNGGDRRVRPHGGVRGSQCAPGAKFEHSLFTFEEKADDDSAPRPQVSGVKNTQKKSRVASTLDSRVIFPCVWIDNRPMSARGESSLVAG